MIYAHMASGFWCACVGGDDDGTMPEPAVIEAHIDMVRRGDCDHPPIRMDGSLNLIICSRCAPVESVALEPLPNLLPIVGWAPQQLAA
jgi:hypothetical protein